MACDEFCVMLWVEYSRVEVLSEMLCNGLLGPEA